MHNEFWEMRIHSLLADLGWYVRRARNLPWGTSRMLYGDVIPVGESPVILDIGANVGQTSKAFAHSFPNAAIHALEPFPRIFAVCQRNLRRVPQVRCHQLALGERCETRSVALVTNDDHYTANQITRSADASTPGDLREEVRVTTLDTFLREQAIPAVHILKLDTEGNELAVFRGGAEALARGTIRSILVETTLQEGNTYHVRLDDVNACLTPHGYRFHGIYDYSYQPELQGEMHVFSALYKLRSPRQSLT